MKKLPKWSQFINRAHGVMIEESDTRELGKIRAIANEFVVLDYINDHTNLTVKRRADVKYGDGYPIEDGDKNESGYDLVSKSGLRIQVKYRSKDLHFENTRRHSKKNKGSASKTGHTAYSVGEFDVVVFTRPTGPADEISVSTNFLAIPACALEDKLNPGFCRPRVNKPVWTPYSGKCAETLEKLDARKAKK